MRTLLIAAALVAAVLSSAQAATFNYACTVEDGPRAHLYAAKLDTTKKTITWRGVVYRNMEAETYDECAKDCYLATLGDASVELVTQTQGAATLQFVPREDGLQEFNCVVLP